MRILQPLVVPQFEPQERGTICLGAELFRSSSQAQRPANWRRTPAPASLPSQKVWLSTKDLQLQVESRKLALHFVGQFEVQLLVNPAVVRLKLSTSI